MVITLYGVRNPDLYNLYYMMKGVLRYESQPTREIIHNWCQNLFDAFRVKSKHNIVFRGEDANVIIHVAHSYIKNCGDGEYIDFARNIMKVAASVQ